MTDASRNVHPPDGEPRDTASATPIYDALVDQWRTQEREIPRPPDPAEARSRADREPRDLFRRA
ncbi:hypothetical protein [Streptomyces sp. NPDC047123]|uniref:hypothetical protein n=1 Tax=unclassified Streptomyces TaxID=2593676 RepID=UPI0033D06BDC